MRSRLGRGGLKIPLKSVRIGYKKREGGGGGLKIPQKSVISYLNSPLHYLNLRFLNSLKSNINDVYIILKLVKFPK